MKTFKVLLSAALLAMGMDALAVSLGSGYGAVVLGSAVDLTFEIRPDDDADVASSCVVAEVLAGDALVPAEKVRVQPLPEAPGRPSAVRVTTSVVIEELFLSVKLTAGCGSKFTRTYTFLADPPPGSASAPSRTAERAAARFAPEVQAPGSSLPSASGPVTEPVVQPQSPQRAPRAKSTPSELAPPRKRSELAASPSAPPAVRTPAPQPVLGPRLVMAPLERPPEPAPHSPGALRMSQALTALPAQASAVATRVAALEAWKALNAPIPEAWAARERTSAQATAAISAPLAAPVPAARKGPLQWLLLASYGASFVLVVGLLAMLAHWLIARRRAQRADPTWFGMVNMEEADLPVDRGFFDRRQRAMHSGRSRNVSAWRD